jgi:membrane protein YdbS with pleckstrin-like domain
MTTTEPSAEGAAALDNADAEDPLPEPSLVVVPEPEPEPAPPVQGPPSVADGVERSLDPRAVALAQMVGWMITGALSLGLLIAQVILFLAEAPAPIRTFLGLLWLGGMILLGWLSYRWPQIEHRHASYKVDPQGIEIRKGVVWRRVINVPRSRVQHTDVSQGPLERNRGLGTLVIYTAGTDHARVDLGGLDHATALRIREHLVAGEGADAV